MTDDTSPAEVAKTLRTHADRIEKLEIAKPQFNEADVEKLKRIAAITEELERSADIIDENEALAEGVMVARVMRKVGVWLFSLVGGFVVLIKYWQDIISFFGKGSP